LPFFTVVFFLTIASVATSTYYEENPTKIYRQDSITIKEAGIPFFFTKNHLNRDLVKTGAQVALRPVLYRYCTQKKAHYQ